jgi:hypothetical protein
VTASSQLTQAFSTAVALVREGPKVLAVLVAAGAGDAAVLVVSVVFVVLLPNLG